MKLKFLSVMLSGFVAITAHANPTDPKVLCQQLTTELGAFVDGFIATAPRGEKTKIRSLKISSFIFFTSSLVFVISF